jgi:hypothetical protein
MERVALGTGYPSVTLFITFSIWQVNANPSEFYNFLKNKPFSPRETELRVISSPISDKFGGHLT